MRSLIPRRGLVAVLWLALFLLAACRDEAVPTPAPSAAAPSSTGDAAPQDEGSAGSTAGALAPTESPPTPSPTPAEPLAALVNGVPIFLKDYEKEVARYEQAQAELGLAPVEGDVPYREQVLDALIETELIAQAAQANGIVLTAETVEQRLQDLATTSGGADNFAAWLQANQWTEEEFRQALAKEMLAERMVQYVTADVPTAVEQVRARYIQVDDQALADSLLVQLQNGADFTELARQHSVDRITGENGGDLGFFAPGSLLVPQVESAAFAQQPGEISNVIAAPRSDGTGTAYYIVTVIERDPQRALSADLRFQLLQERFEAWLVEQWASADIQRLVDVSG